MVDESAGDINREVDTILSTESHEADCPSQSWIDFARVYSMEMYGPEAVRIDQ